MCEGGTESKGTMFISNITKFGKVFQGLEKSTHDDNIKLNFPYEMRKVC